MPSPEAALKKFSAVVITGGSSGIGKSFIELCGKLCPDLSFCNLSRRKPDINSSKLKLRHVACDLTDSAQLATGIETIRNFLAVDVPAGQVLLINNSGFGTYDRFPAPNVGEQLTMIDLNVRAVVHMTGELLPVMKERGGVILTVASVAAFQPTPFIGVYGATKAFALHWSLALNEELRGSGVSTLAVCPGPTSTDFFRRAGLDKDAGPGGFGTTEGVVMASLRALASGRAMVVPGWRNKLLAASSVLATKPMLARMAGIAIGRYRVKRIKT